MLSLALSSLLEHLLLLLLLHDHLDELLLEVRFRALLFHSGRVQLIRLTNSVLGGGTLLLRRHILLDFLRARLLIVIIVVFFAFLRGLLALLAVLGGGLFARKLFSFLLLGSWVVCLATCCFNPDCWRFLLYFSASELLWLARKLLGFGTIAKGETMRVVFLVGALRHAVTTVLLFAALTHFTLILK